MGSIESLSVAQSRSDLLRSCRCSEENLAVIGAPEQGGMLNGGLGLLGEGPGKVYVYRRGGGGGTLP